MKPFRMTHTEKKFCPFCGKQSPITNKYCVECGYEIPEISFFPQNNNTQPQSDREQNQQSQTIGYSPTAKKTRRYGWLIFFLALAALLVYTNPNEKKHIDFIKQSIDDENIDKTSARRESGVPVTNSYYDTDFRRTDYIFFSINEIQANEQWKLFSIGILGYVIPWQDVKNNLNLQLNQLTKISYNYEGTYKTNGYTNKTNEFLSAKVEKKENGIYVMTFNIVFFNMKFPGKLEGNKLVFNIDSQTVEIIGDTFYFAGMEFTKIK